MRISWSSAVVVVVGVVCAVGCNPPPPQVNAGSTGAFGVVTVGGKQKLYLPSGTTDANGHGFVSVVDVGVGGHGVAGAPALTKVIDLGLGVYPTCTGGDASVVVAASTAFRTVWLIDPASDTVKTKLDLPASYGNASYSGGAGIVNGVAMDSDHHRAILAVYNGFAIVDTVSGTLTNSIEAPPSENFGFDATTQKIFAPFYDCSNASDASGTPLPICDNYKDSSGYDGSGLNVIDLTSNTVYRYSNPTALDPYNPLGDEPDSATVDTSSHVAVVPSEGSGAQNILDIAHATFDAAAKTFTAPVHVVNNGYYTGVAAEPGKHFAFFEAEHSDNIGVIDLAAANTGAGVLRNTSMPSTPDTYSWSNMGDPHGIAVTTGINDGHSVGFVVSSNLHWVARVDLEKLNSAPVDSSGNLLATDTASAISYLDATTHE